MVATVKYEIINNILWWHFSKNDLFLQNTFSKAYCTYDCACFTDVENSGMLANEKKIGKVTSFSFNYYLVHHVYKMTMVPRSRVTVVRVSDAVQIILQIQVYKKICKNSQKTSPSNHNVTPTRLHI